MSSESDYGPASEISDEDTNQKVQPLINVNILMEEEKKSSPKQDLEGAINRMLLEQDDDSINDRYTKENVENEIKAKVGKAKKATSLEHKHSGEDM